MVELELFFLSKKRFSSIIAWYYMDGRNKPNYNQELQNCHHPGEQ